MKQLRAALLDIGGVVYVGDEPLPGVVAAVEELRKIGLAIRFLTNTTRLSRRAVLAKLHAMGVPAEEEELFTPAAAARRIIMQRDLAPHLLIHPDLAEDFAGLPESENLALLVGDAGAGFTYDAMNAAFRVLDRGAQFLALANNKSFRDADGSLSLDAGPFVAALAFASGCEPEVLGKPSAAFFRAALDSVGCAPDEAVMVGDDVENDVAGAMAAGINGILVRTGKYEPDDETRIDPQPVAVLDSLAALPDWVTKADR